MHRCCFGLSWFGLAWFSLTWFGLMWLGLLGFGLAAEGPQGVWQAASGPLMTRWAKEVSPQDVHRQYPRPQMVRKNWVNLNGLWHYAITPRRRERAPDRWDGQILVPFAIESALSGVKKKVGPENRLWYQRKFVAPRLPPESRLLLHFEAVDWQTTVWVNGFQVGQHKGGYDPLTCDITEALYTRKSPTEELVVSVWDPTDAGYQPRGKQVQNPHGIWYTSVTGIWQTVWLEVVPATSIASVTVTTLDWKSGQAAATVTLRGQAQDQAELVLEVLDDQQTSLSRTVAKAGPDQRVDRLDPQQLQVKLTIPRPRPWSPKDPYLYGLRVALKVDGQIVDQVESYLGLRQIEMKKAKDGFNRIFLNGEALFLYGPLDQGWWPDGLYTAPTDEALRYDLEVTKKLGMNMCRKHVKVEPRRWYYWADKLGLLVWQDMPNGDRHIRADQADLNRSPESAANFRREWKAIIQNLRGHPSIIVWVPFNEGWGQFQTDRILEQTKQWDPTRLVDGPSGWTDRGTGQLHDIHRYPGPAMPEPEEHRAAVLGEFGGLGWPVEGHLWWKKRNWGYRTYQSQQELQRNYELLMDRLRPLIGRGLAAAIYTQTTDVEGEVNGLMTYDRALTKFDAQRLQAIHKKFSGPPVIIETTSLVPTSEQEPQIWRSTTNQPQGDWTAKSFDDSSWQEMPGGFGEKTTPGAVVRTSWKTNDLWLRRKFVLNNPTGEIRLRVHHDEDAQIYINGKKVASLTGYVTQYQNLPFPQAAEVLVSGTNTLAVHCRQTQGGQYIDVGIVALTELATPKKLTSSKDQ